MKAISISPEPWGQPHRTLTYYSKAWHLSRAVVKRMFEPYLAEIIKIGDGRLKPGKKRAQVHWRIPDSLGQRVYAEYTGRKVA